MHTRGGTPTWPSLQYRGTTGTGAKFSNKKTSHSAFLAFASLQAMLVGMQRHKTGNSHHDLKLCDEGIVRKQHHWNSGEAKQNREKERSQRIVQCDYDLWTMISSLCAALSAVGSSSCLTTVTSHLALLTM